MRWATSIEPTCDETLTILPLRGTRLSAEACTINSGPSTLTSITARNCSSVMSSAPLAPSSAPTARASMPALL